MYHLRITQIVSHVIFLEVRLQERVFLGIGNKPFMDIQPSEAAINDRAIDYVLMGRGEYLMFLNKFVTSQTLTPFLVAENRGLFSVGSCASRDELPGGRPKSAGSRSSSSSSSSSGRGSLSPVGYLCGPKQKVIAGVLGRYASPPGALEEDDLDQESGSQHLLCE